MTTILFCFPSCKSGAFCFFVGGGGIVKWQLQTNPPTKKHGRNCYVSLVFLSLNQVISKALLWLPHVLVPLCLERHCPSWYLGGRFWVFLIQISQIFVLSLTDTSIYLVGKKIGETMAGFLQIFFKPMHFLFVLNPTLQRRSTSEHTHTHIYIYVCILFQ